MSIEEGGDEFLVVPASGISSVARGPAAHWGVRRSTASCSPGSRAKGLEPAPPADKRDSAAPRHLRSDRTAAHAEGDRGLSRRRVSRGFREGRRPPAGLAALRRALGPALAGRGALRGLDRQRRGSSLSLRLALSRLRDRRLQPGHAVRPVRARADRRRPAAAADGGASTARGIVATGFLALGARLSRSRTRRRCCTTSTTSRSMSRAKRSLD